MSDGTEDPADAVLDAALDALVSDDEGVLSLSRAERGPLTRALERARATCTLRDAVRMLVRLAMQIEGSPASEQLIVLAEGLLDAMEMTEKTGGPDGFEINPQEEGPHAKALGLVPGAIQPIAWAARIRDALPARTYLRGGLPGRRVVISSR